ncbi:hypothetical protein [Kibdelosporangium phytohabitans]|uniref:Uncharacterized protein n=1 Tax=Kibdelosporangium phytohabitans TaxID=860235 RepID=A0A0N9I0K7_9PSEU|nr:hypothetical protein [Kibdelosporangium phytohabitans]ALG11118.1 hypothetical protein AOZ06_33335 [Kibdelosporangium phytohabitans]MBE1462366.1 hypothetical protein [Kibdelosporangium phytohabitans]
MTQDPVARYKEILDVTRQAAQKLAERERRRRVEVVTEITAADREIKAAAEEEEQVRKEITGWWRQVVARMDGISWISRGPLPDPDPAGRPDRLDDYIAEIEPATNAFTAALRKAVWPKKL